MTTRLAMHDVTVNTNKPVPTVLKLNTAIMISRATAHSPKTRVLQTISKILIVASYLNPQNDDTIEIIDDVYVNNTMYGNILNSTVPKLVIFPFTMMLGKSDGKRSYMNEGRFTTIVSAPVIVVYLKLT